MKSIGTLRVIKIKEHKDGSATIYFGGITKEVKEVVKKIYKAKRFTAKLFRRMVIEGLFHYIKQEYPKLAEKEKLDDWF